MFLIYQLICKYVKSFPLISALLVDEFMNCLNKFVVFEM